MKFPFFGDESARFPPAEGRIERLKRVIASMPDLRRKKIEAIKRAIQENRYRVGTEELAKRLVNEAANDAIHRGRQGLTRWPSAI